MMYRALHPIIMFFALAACFISCKSKQVVQQGVQNEEGRQIIWRNGGDTYTIYQNSRNVYLVEVKKLVLLSKAGQEVTAEIFTFAASSDFKAAAAEHISDDTPKFFIDYINGTEVLRVIPSEESTAPVQALLARLMSVI